MDGDPSVERELDSLGLYLPLPYRIAFALVLGVWAWGANLHYLYLLKIDVPALLCYPSRTSLSASPHYRSVYRLAYTLSIALALCLALFWVATRGNPSAVRSWEVLPNLYLIFLALFFLWPSRKFSGSGRSRFISTLKRISIGGLEADQDGRFGDILLADALTSYAKVLGDLFVSMCLLFSRGRSSTGHPDRNCGGFLIVPLILAIPSIIRFRQCMTEYQRVRLANMKSDDMFKGSGRVHLANAIKYSTAFPVIILSAIQRNHDPEKSYIGHTPLFRLWIFFVSINSAYSFYWDVARDWDLKIFSADRNDPEHPWGLRKHRYIQAKELYYFVIALDLLLRFTWSLKLSPHLDHYNDIEGGIFVLELLEIFRRWIWVFLRVETECVRNYRGPAPDDILLGDYGQSD